MSTARSAAAAARASQVPYSRATMTADTTTYEGPTSMRYLSSGGSTPRDTRYSTMPSLTSVPITWPATHTTASRQLPSAWLAPNMASVISTGQTTGNSPETKAETISVPTGLWCRLCTLVLAHTVSASWSCGDSSP